MLLVPLAVGQPLQIVFLVRQGNTCLMVNVFLAIHLVEPVADIAEQHVLLASPH